MKKEVLALILGGGQGARLFPLTLHRSKPAVPLGGKYRLIDITVSNCINSGIHYIYVLTQFNSASLNRHVSNTYQLDLFSGGFVEILAAEQTPESQSWFQGTADAVRKAARHFQQYGPQDDIKISELFEALVIVAHQSMDRLSLGELPRRGAWGSQTEKNFPIAIGQAIARAIVEEYSQWREAANV